MKIKKESDSARSELETVASIMLALVERIPEEQVSDKKLKELATALWARPKKVAELDRVDGSLYKTRATMFKKCLVAANSTMPETPPVVIQKVQTIILKPDKINCDKIAQKATGGKTIEIKKSGAIKVHDKEDTQEVLSFAESLLSEFAVLEGWKERVAEWTTYIKKRREVSPEQLTEFFAILKEQATNVRPAIVKWWADSKIIVPEDLPKVEQAVKLAGNKGADPLKYDSPMGLINEFGDFKSGAKLIDADDVPELSNKQDWGHGVTVYDVEDNEAGQEAVRKILNNNYGNEFSPWRLLHGNGNGGLSTQAWDYWEHYSNTDKKIAFQNGKAIAFYATASEPTWWDLKDHAHEGIPVKEKISGDSLGRERVIEIYEDGSVITLHNGMSLGDKQDGEYKEWDEYDTLRIECRYKNGKLDGEYKSYYDNGELKEQRFYKNDKLEGESKSYYDNGSLWMHSFYKNDKLDGEYKSYYDKGELKTHCFYKDGKLEGEYKRYSDNSKRWEHCFYMNDKREGEYKRYSDNSKRWEHCFYKNDKREGEYKSYYDNGELMTHCFYKNDKLDGEYKSYYDNGELKTHGFYKDGKLEGEYKRYEDDGKRWKHCFYKNGVEVHLPDNLKDDETPEEPIQESMRDTVAAGLLGLMGATGLLADTEYTVKPGDTLYAIAQKNDTSVRDLKKLNPGIDDINKINVGDKVKIPGEAEPIEDTKKNPEAIKKNPEAIKKNPEAIKKNPEAIKKTFKAAPPPMLVNHKIVRGDSLSKIANIYGDSIKAIKERNGISDNDVRKLKIGDVLSVGKYVVDPGKELNLPVPKHLPDFIKKWEAYRNDAYLCPAGEWTIGYGRTRNKDGSLVKPGDKAHGRSLEHKYLMDELERLNRIVNRYLKTELNPNQLAALLSFGYNTGGYSMVPIIKDQINLGDMKDAIDRMGTYINVKDEETGEKKEEKGLINRRAEERKLWDGKYDKKSENRLNKHKPDTFAEHLLEFYI